MVQKQVASHGEWESPISADSVVGSRSLSSPRVAHQCGRSFFAESRPGGGITIMEMVQNGVKNVLPDEFSVANRVYEYGASLYDVLPDGRAVFSNRDDSVRILDPDRGEVSLLTRGEKLRYASFNASPCSPWVLAIEEDHTHDTPTQIRNYLVAINTATAEVKRVKQGADFYFAPSFSHDGSRIAWLEWDHPGMVFDDARACYASFDNESATLGSPRLLFDAAVYESIAEPRWGPDGSLFACAEHRVGGDFRELYRLRPGSQTPELINLNLSGTEVGEVRLFEGSRTYVPLSGNSLAMSTFTRGTAGLICVDLETLAWRPIALPEQICHINFDAIARLSEKSLLVIASGTQSKSRVYQVDTNGTFYVIRESSDEIFLREYISLPQHIQLGPDDDGVEGALHGFLWMPRNARFAAPEGELPPLVIYTHGGPTGYSGCGLTLRTQYFTSRGYAYALINYTGSTGHGKAYRQKLYGNWGLVDASDSARFAKYLVSQGVVKEGAVGVTGISAGGYNTLQSLVKHSSSFAGGFCVSGISDLARFDATTHKLEWNYTPRLVLPRIEGVPERLKQSIYRERSALYHTGAIAAPLLLLHGAADSVVPVEQARLLADALQEQGRDVRIIEVEGEGHMMGKPASARLWLLEEEKWWRRTLLGLGGE